MRDNSWADKNRYEFLNICVRMAAVSNKNNARCLDEHTKLLAEIASIVRENTDDNDNARQWFGHNQH